MRNIRAAARLTSRSSGRTGLARLGSHVLAMRWVHDLAAFNRLSVEDQQRVIGRTKADSVELAPADKPPNAQIARVEASVDGKELEIFRRSVPFGTAEEHALYFVAFSAQRSRYDRVLARMFGTPATVCATVSPTFSRSVSGACYFVSLDVLNELAGPDVDR